MFTDFDQQEKVGTIRTILDFGGVRLAISEDETICIAASYYSPGLRTYSVASGEIVWERRDLRKIQSIGILLGNLLAVEIDSKPLQVLDLRTAAAHEAVRGGTKLIVSPFSPVRFVNKHVPELQKLNGDCIAKIRRDTFAIIAAVFTPDLVVISESTGGVRAFCAKTGKPQWRYDPRSKTHVLELGYNEHSGEVLGVLWPFYDGGEKFLLVFDAETGGLIRELKIGEHACERFCSRGTKLLTSNGQLIDTTTGKIVKRYRFPKL